jgi:plasmid stability protein
LDEDVVRRLRARAAEHGRSAEAEHRKILRLALAADPQPKLDREQVAERLAEFRQRLAGRGLPPAVELLEESRNERMRALMGESDGP